MTDLDASLSFVRTYQESVERYNELKQLWVENLRSQGISAAYPLDGWVNPVKREVISVNPYFVNSLSIGDKIAIGDYREYSVFEISGIHKSKLFNLTYYQYQDPLGANNGL